MRPTASPAALSEGNAPCGDLQGPVPTGSLSLWTRQDRQLFAALPSSGGGTLHGTSHSDPLWNEPATGQPEASADRPAPKRYEKPQPGHRVQVDVKFLERIAGSRKRL